MGKRPNESSITMPFQEMQAVSPASRPRYVPAVAVAAFVLTVCGCIGSVWAAQSQARRDSDTARAAFERTSADVASSLGLAISREQDLVVNAAGFFLARPDAGNVEFANWSSAVQAMGRYPELLAWGEVVVVPAAGLDTFIADQRGGGSTWAAPFAIVPAGVRPYYCLLRVGQTRGGSSAASSGFDYCASTSEQVPLDQLDPGTGGYRVVDAGAGTTLAAQVPFYRGGVTPPTAQGRRDAFVGWMGMGFDPALLLAAAVDAHTVSAVGLSFGDAGSNIAFDAGTIPVHAQLESIALRDGWVVTTFGSRLPTGVLANGNSVALLAAGILCSTLVGLFIFVLGTGRARAMRLVVERTRELRHLALHDALTGLPNRALILHHCERMLVRDRAAHTVGAALYIDLDDFKNVNDTLGHQTGDRLLVAVAERLGEAMREADTIGRMGGDEFVVLVDGARLEAAPERVAARLLSALRLPFLLEDVVGPLLVNASIGIALGDRPTGGDLLRDADVALYEAKAAGKNRYAIFRPEMQDEINRRVVLEFELRSAIDKGQFRLAYQPIYNLDDLTLVGVEALLRWDHPTLGAIGPDEFVPILEHTGQIVAVGRWVLFEACRQMSAWHDRGDVLDISVNVSGVQLDDDVIIDDIRAALQCSGLTATTLTVEVTETALMRDAAAAAKRLRQIKDLGVRIAIDDFGTGYSSLAYLQQFPADCLKIDRRFTNAMATSPESKALMETLVQLGKNLGLTTLAEGVETTMEMDHLRDQKVDLAQGFLLSRPLDPVTFETQLLEPARAGAQIG